MHMSEVVLKPIDRVGPLQKSATEERFTRMAETLDAAGFGPADYLYLPLKWRVQKPDIKRFAFGSALRRAVKEALVNPQPIPRTLQPSPILIASTYGVSAKLFRQVVATLEPAECAFYYLGDIPPRSLASKLSDYRESWCNLGLCAKFCLRRTLNFAKGEGRRRRAGSRHACRLHPSYVPPDRPFDLEQGPTEVLGDRQRQPSA